MKQINIKVKRNVNVKKDHLSVDINPKEDTVSVIVSDKISEEEARILIGKYMERIEYVVKKYEDHKKLLKREYVTGENHHFLGKVYKLKVIESNKPKIEIKGKYINLYAKPNSSKEDREKVLINFYKRELKKILPPLIKKWEEKLNFKFNKIKLVKRNGMFCEALDEIYYINPILARNRVECLEYMLIHMIMINKRVYTGKAYNPRYHEKMWKIFPEWSRCNDEIYALVQIPNEEIYFKN